MTRLALRLVPATMTVCVAYALVLLVQQFRTDWSYVYLSPLCGLALFEAMVMYGARQALSPTVRPAMLTIELAALVLVWQGWSDLASGLVPLQYGVAVTDPLAMLPAIPVAAAWLIGLVLGRDLAFLAGGDPWATAGRRAERHLRLAVVCGGIALIASTWLVDSELNRLSDQFAAGGPVWLLPLYAALSVILMGWTRAAALRSEWTRRGVRVADDVSRSWPRYLTPALAILLLAALLPHLTSPVATAATRTGRGSMDAAWPLLSRIGPDLGRQLASLGLRPDHVRVDPRATPIADLPRGVSIHVEGIHAPDHHHSSSGGGRAGWVRVAGLSWVRAGGLLLLAALALVYGWRLRQNGRNGFQAITLARALRRMLARARQAVARRVPRRMAGAVPGRRAGGFKGTARPDLGGADASAGQRIQALYLDVVRRARRRGLPRHVSSTPHEFAATLALRLPDVAADVQALADSYTQSRYSGRDLEAAECERLVPVWERACRAIRGLKTR